MRVRMRLVLVCLVAVLATGVLPTTARLDAQSADERSLAVVRAAYTNLLDLYFQTVEPAALLTAGWDSLTSRARTASLPAPPALGTLPPEREAAFAAFASRYQAYLTGLTGHADAVTLAFDVADGMARSLKEQHTYFLPPENYRAVLSATGGGEGSAGLGVQLKPGPPFIITEVLPDGPAARAGIVPGDVVTALNGRPLTGTTVPALIRAVSNSPEGERVTLTVERDRERRDVIMTATGVYWPPLRSHVVREGVGYIRLTNFVQSGATLLDGSELLADLDRRLDDFERSGVRALVLDLRGNPGGLVLTAAELLGRFLPEDALTVIQSDGQGRRAVGIVSGRMRETQWPLAVLVDGNSYSASEITAATLKEANRAVLVGERTGGSLNYALILPLPEAAGLVVTVSEVVTAKERTKVDRAGVPVDVAVRDTRTAADYRTGYDPQLEAALTALSQAPAPPAYLSRPASLSSEQLRQQLTPYMPDPAAIPRNERLTSVMVTTRRELTHPNQAIQGARDPLAVQEAFRRRGWRGGYSQGYGAGPLTRPSVDVSVDLYETEAGAADAVAENDAPDFQEVVPVPVSLGEQSIAYRGTWGALGGTSFTWRRGAAVFTVSYGDVPGYERMDILGSVAQLVDAAYTRNPLPVPAQPTPAASVDASPAAAVSENASAEGADQRTWLVAGAVAAVLLAGAGTGLAARRTRRG